MANTLRFKRGLVSGIPTAALGEPLFTTDTFDLYIGNGTGNTRFQKYIASGTTSQLLRGDGSLLTMPIVLTSPANGEVLKYNGTNWVNSSDAGVTGSGTAGQVTFWNSGSTITGSNNLFWDATNSRLGIGTNTPSYSLHVKSGNITTLKLDNDNSRYVQLLFERNTVANTGADFLLDGTNGTFSIRTLATYPLIFSTAITTGNSVERARITSTGNFIINNASTDNGLRFQVTGDASVNGNTASYIAQLNQANTTAGASFGTIIRGGTNVSDSALRIQNAAQSLNLLTVQGNGSLGLGTTLVTGYNVRINKTITGSAVAYGIDIDGAIQSDVTNSAVIYGTSVGTQATAFSLSNLYHYNATQGTFGAGSAVTSQFGFRVSHNMVGATNNYAYYGEIPSGTGRWNLYMNGTAANYLAGNLSIGTANTTHALDIQPSGGTPTFRIARNGGTDFRISSSVTAGGGVIGTYTASPILFYINSATAMTLDASGNLGLGVTPSAWGNVSRAIQIGAFASVFGSSSNFGGLATNRYNDNANNRYIGTGASALYEQGNGIHYWYNAPSGTAGNVISYTQAMTLDASGNLLVGNTTGTSKLDVAKSAADTLSRANSAMAIGDFVFGAGLMLQQRLSAPYGFMIQATNSTAATFYPILLNSSGGNVVIGATTDAGFKLDVNGTMRVSGASTLNGFTTITNTGGGAFTSQLRLQNSTSSATLVSFENTLNGYAFGLNTTGTQRFVFINGGLSEIASISGAGAATFSSSVTAGSFIPTDTTAPTNGLYLPASNTLGFATVSGEKMRLNATGNLGLGTTSPTDSASFGRALDVSGVNGAALYLRYSTDPTVQYGYIGYDRTGLGVYINTNNALPITFATNNTTRLTIASTGAATFSSSVTVNGDAIFGSQVKLKTYSDVSSSGIFDGATLGANNFFYWNAGRAFFGTNGAERMRLDSSGNLGIAMTPSYKLDVTGEARVSNAIAIGTTPDTNKPFKILKNINGTVGINFENTSTGASAFSAIQMGTDVSGGTAFANLVYSSSGVTAAGVYQPSGTSLINTGSGGLNFLSVSQPIRFFTSTGNGTERLRITNDGDITHYNGTSPSASTTDAYRMYSADVVAGNAAPHFRTENGAVIKLYQETTGVGNAIFSQGGGNSVLDDSTFDGYTLRQIVKALRNQGILA